MLRRDFLKGLLAISTAAVVPTLGTSFVENRRGKYPTRVVLFSGDEPVTFADVDEWDTPEPYVAANKHQIIFPRWQINRGDFPSWVEEPPRANERYMITHFALVGPDGTMLKEKLAHRCAYGPGIGLAFQPGDLQVTL